MQTYSNDIQRKQLEGVKDVIKFLNDDNSQDGIIECLVESLRIKERAARKLLDFLKHQVIPLYYQGLSVVSVGAICEAVSSEVTQQAAMMELYAHHLARVTHTPDIRRAYEAISLQLTAKADDLLTSIREKVENAVSDPETMAYAEGADVVANLYRDNNS